MKEFIFTDSVPELSFSWDFEETLFNTREHRLLQLASGWQSFYVLRTGDKKIAASLHFNIRDGIAASPLRAPFGSCEASRTLPHSILFEFLQFAEERLRALQVRHIHIVTPPQAYTPLNTVVNTFFINLGFHASASELSAIIPVGKGELSQRMNRGKIRRLKKSESSGLVFRRLPESDAQPIYRFIEECRKQKGYSLSMSCERLLESVRAFPGRYLFFAVERDGTLAAASIAIRVSSTIMYEFYHDHAAAFDDISPVVMLVDGIYRFCQSENIELFDLGTSALEGKPNFSLLDFKLQLGGEPSPKFTFAKALS